MSIRRRRTSVWVPGAGTTRSERRSSTAIATFRVEAANGARAFHDASRPVRRSRTRIAHACKPSGQRANRQRQRRIVSFPGSALRRSDSREPEHRADDSGRPATEIVERSHTNRDVPAWKVDLDGEPRRRPAADENANAPRSGETCPRRGRSSPHAKRARRARAAEGPLWKAAPVSSGGWSDAVRAAGCRPRQPILRAPPAGRRRSG